MRPDANKVDVPKIQPQQIQSQQNERIEEIRSYELITPLFGGGVEPKVADPITTVRVPEIRGHLRFWWRACRGGQFDGDLDKMKAAEDAIWGSASQPSAVNLALVEVHSGTEVRDPLAKNSDIPRYAVFPMESDPKPLREAIRFKLGIHYEKKIAYKYKDQEKMLSGKAEIEAALWAWETFGGIGGRTRRGFGAVQCTDPAKPIPAPKVADHIRAMLEHHVVEGEWPKDVPHLSKTVTVKVTDFSRNATQAWNSLISELKNFRQYRVSGNKKKGFGRSRWPEPDEIRRRTGQAASKLSKPISKISKFPRGQFGLPIIFHFKDQGDPEETTLQGKEHDRFASRLILRPFACVDNKAVGLAMVLEGPTNPPGGLVLKGAPGNPAVSSELDPLEARNIEPLNIEPLRGETDVLKAFLNTLK